MHAIVCRPLCGLVLALATLLAGTPAHASRPLAAPVQLSIIDSDDRDSLLTAYPDGRQHWIAGTPGHRYSVRMTNISSRRVLVVLSVDGVNAISGETAHPSQSGYVLGPWQTTRVDGWRKSMDDVARFVFTDHHRSYAARTGRPGNVGVIGIAVFHEAGPPRFEHAPSIGRAERESRRDTAAPAPDASSDTLGRRAMAEHKADRQQLGTGHGEQSWSPVSRTRFVRASRHPIQVTELRYDARDRLVAMGIVPRHRSPIDTPRAFPSGFVADPPPRH